MFEQTATETATFGRTSETSGFQFTEGKFVFIGEEAYKEFVHV